MQSSEPCLGIKNKPYKTKLKKGLPLVDKFRTANWAGIKSDLQFSGILGLFPMLELQN
jgi:hypothetical protein